MSYDPVPRESRYHQGVLVAVLIKGCAKKHGTDPGAVHTPKKNLPRCAAVIVMRIWIVWPAVYVATDGPGASYFEDPHIGHVPPPKPHPPLAHTEPGPPPFRQCGQSSPPRSFATTFLALGTSMYP